MKPFHLALLGSFRARAAGGRPLPIHRRKAQALLAYLAMRAGAPQSREKVIGLLWSDLDADRARHSLRQTLTVLRRDLATLGASPAFLAGEALRLDPRLVTVDVTRFERLAARADARSLEQAAALYRGELLEGLAGAGAAFEAWLAMERERVRAMAVHALDRLLALRIAAGATAATVDTALAVLAVDPGREDVHRLLMRLHAEQGRRAAAIRQYRACADVLQRDLGVMPEAETTELHHAILARSVPPVDAAEAALRLHALAVDGAVMRSAFPEALAGLERALAAVDELPAGPRRRAAQVDARLGFERVLMPLAQLDRLHDVLVEAERHARALGDARRLAWIASQRMSCELWDGRAEAAIASGTRALEVAVATRDVTLALTTRCRLVQAQFYVGDFRQGVRAAEALVAGGVAGELSLAGAAQGALPAIHWRAYLALCLTGLGAFARAHEVAVEAGRLAERAGHEWSLAFARSALGVCELLQGRAREACDAFMAALALQQGPDGRGRFVLPGAPIGSALALAGRSAEGIALIESAVREAAPRGFGTFRQRSLATLARCRLRQGRLAEALAHAEESLRLARAQRQRAGEAWGLHLLAEILGQLDGDNPARRARALFACRDALARAEALGMRPLAVQCHETLGHLLERAGDPGQARAARDAAASLRGEIGLVARGA